MIISCLTDRLGNQLFQYAAAKSLAAQTNTNVKLDKRYYDITVTGASYELDVFSIPQQFVSNQELRKYTWPSESGIYRVLKKIFPRKTVYEKTFYKYDDGFHNLGNEVYLRGWWQSYKYFEGIENILRKELVFKKKLSGLNKEVSIKIEACNSISLHVRRGDYVKNKVDNEKFGLCSKEYYKEAIRYMQLKVSKPHFFIFSDDKEWIQKEIKIEGEHTFVLHNDGKNSFEDMRLMSLCKHHIIANSTFSWWGAWLNPEKDKTVIAPKRWLNGSISSTSDLCPPSWIRL